MTKSEIRAEMRRRRKAVAPAERAAASTRICERLSAMKFAGPVAVYLASSDEIDLSAFVEDCLARGVSLVAPRWNGVAYELAELNDCWPDGLVAGPHGILEPPQDAPMMDSRKVYAWIVPGLAFTQDGGRLGYGGGWYDRMMATARADVRKIGVGHRFQVVDALPSEAHDVRLAEVVTD